MLTNIKALIVLLTLAVASLYFTKPISQKYCDAQDFARRRNLWFTFTILGALSPSFWLFTLVAVPLLIWAVLRDSTPIALYIFLLHVIPPRDVDIPVLGINTLFYMNMYRLLSIFVLLPSAIRIWKQRDEHPDKRPIFFWTDILLLAYGVLQILLFVRPDIPDASALHDSATNMLRRGTLFIIDAVLPYYVFSRSCTTKRALADVMATACIATVIMAPAAIFENVRHWLLYANFGQSWNAVQGFYYNFRAGLVRASLSSGHPLALGYLLALGLGFWLYLRTKIKPAILRFGVPTLLILGLIAAYSRGPWVGAIVVYLAFIGLAPGGQKRFLKSLLGVSLGFAALLLSPLGDRIRAVIPFLGGTVDQFNVTYRQKLGERALDMILHGPLLGDQDAYSKMHDLRQGVGVIDFVNTYAEVGVFNGIVGLAFFVGFILLALFKAYSSVRRVASTNADLALMGLSIAACIVGTLAMIYTSSFIYSYALLFYVLAGMAVGYQKCCWNLDPTSGAVSTTVAARSAG